MILFDIGANRGDAVVAGLNQGYKVIALEPAPRIFKQLVQSWIYYPDVIPLKMAVSDENNQQIEFYEADEDGLSTINKEWLTADNMPYANKPFRTISATTITIDSLIDIYGQPDLMKIDVEGAEWSVFKGMTKYSGKLTFEWTKETLSDHQDQLDYLLKLGYTEVAPQFIVKHLQEPTEWFKLDQFVFKSWLNEHKQWWENEGWKEANLRPTADVGMCWVR
jgi:FkbM family methyltransferase